MKKITITFFLLTLLQAGMAEARAQACKRIAFPRGQTSAVVKGRVSAGRPICYLLHARDGQRLVAHITSPGRRVRFSIRPDYYDADFLQGAFDRSDWEGELISEGGNDFSIAVTLAGKNAADSFTLEVAIPGAARGGGSSRAPVAPCGDFSGVYQTHYGPLRLTRTGDQVRGSYSDEGRNGTIAGTVRGNVLSGRWIEVGSKGTFRFTLDADGLSFTGSFAYDGDPNEAGEWGGHCP